MVDTKPMTAQVLAEHRRLLDEIGGGKRGGPRIVAIIEAAHNRKLTLQAVNVWRRRGIPWRYRGCLAVAARASGVSVPAYFFDEGLALQAFDSQTAPRGT